MHNIGKNNIQCRDSANTRNDIDNQDAKFEKYSHKKSKIYRKYLHILKEISIFAKIFTVQ